MGEVSLETSPKNITIDDMINSENSRFIIPQVQSDYLSFYQKAIPRSQGNFSEVWEKSGKIKVEKKWPPCHIGSLSVFSI